MIINDNSSERAPAPPHPPRLLGLRPRGGWPAGRPAGRPADRHPTGTLFVRYLYVICTSLHVICTLFVRYCTLFVHM